VVCISALANCVVLPRGESALLISDRAIMLKGSTIADLRYDALALGVLMLIAMTIAVTRFRRTLD